MITTRQKAVRQPTFGHTTTKLFVRAFEEHMVKLRTITESHTAASLADHLCVHLPETVPLIKSL
jgi:hypothetical protein